MYVIFRIYFSPIIRHVENFKKNILKTLEISKNSNTWDKRISWAPASEIGCMESLP